jgi:hypothetical protein
MITKYAILFLIMSLAITQSVENVKFLETEEFTYEIDKNILIQDTEYLLETVKSGLQGFISDACKNELNSLTSIIDVIKKSSGSDEIIFYTAKDLVNHFSGLRDNCKIPLPNISTDNWNFEKFQEYKCSISVISFAASTAACLEGGLMACGKALVGIKSVADCIRNILK